MLATRVSALVIGLLLAAALPGTSARAQESVCCVCQGCPTVAVKCIQMTTSFDTTGGKNVLSDTVCLGSDACQGCSSINEVMGACGVELGCRPPVQAPAASGAVLIGLALSLAGLGWSLARRRARR